MEPIPFPYEGLSCLRCGKNVFAYDTPNGGDYANCPICGNGCLCCYDFYECGTD